MYPDGVPRGLSLGLPRHHEPLARGPMSVTLVHVLPNISGTLIVQATIRFAIAILAEAGLSYLGLGIQPPTVRRRCT